MASDEATGSSSQELGVVAESDTGCREAFSRSADTNVRLPHAPSLFRGMTPLPVAAGELIPGCQDHEIAAIVALLRSQLIPFAKLASAIDFHGSAVELVQLSDRDELELGDAEEDLVGAVTPEHLGSAFADLRKWRAAGMDIRTVLDDSYPRRLHSIFNRPPLLFVRGDWNDEKFRSPIAIVGTRKASDDGKRRAQRLARELVEAEYSILSGLALGIDTVAHRTALDTVGPTAAVIGTGILRQFPKENMALADEIVSSGGAIVSQFLPEQPPTSWTFPMRNVVMSGMSLATVVVEAGATSGARLQARVALQHGRTVFLLHSLVQSHEWARDYVEKGAYGTHAIEIRATAEILDRLSAEAPSLIWA